MIRKECRTCGKEKYFASHATSVCYLCKKSAAYRTTSKAGYRNKAKKAGTTSEYTASGSGLELLARTHTTKDEQAEREERAAIYAAQFRGWGEIRWGSREIPPGESIRADDLPPPEEEVRPVKRPVEEEDVAED